MTTENRRASFSKWYANNKEKLAAKRAERYKTDPEYQQQAKDRAAAHRAANPRPKKERETHTRVIDGIEREVFRIGTVAKLIGKDEQTIRHWEDKGIIPKPSSPGTHRYYTAHQVQLLRDLCEELGAFRYDSVNIRGALAQKSQEIFASWRN